MTSRIALVTTADLPVPDADEELLLPYLPEATLVNWEDSAVDWASFDLVVVRSTWNYTEHLDDFLAWAARVSEVTTLKNPLDIIDVEHEQALSPRPCRAGFSHRAHHLCGYGRGPSRGHGDTP